MKIIAFLIAVILVQGVLGANQGSVQDIKLKTIEGKPTTLADYKG